MKFLGTLAVGFSSVAAMLAALLSFGFHLKVESPGGAQRSAQQQQQLAQCNTDLSAAKEEIGQFKAQVAGLDTRLAQLALVAGQASARLSAGASQPAQAAAVAVAAEGSGSSPLMAGLGVGVLLFPLGYVLGRRRRDGVPALTAGGGQPLVIDGTASRVLDAVVLPVSARPASARPL